MLGSILLGLPSDDNNARLYELTLFDSASTFGKFVENARVANSELGFSFFDRTRRTSKKREFEVLVDVLSE